MSSNRVQSRYFTKLGLLLIALLAAANSGQAQAVDDPLTGLLHGNERFVKGQLQTRDYLAERPRLTPAQQPYAIVLTCADSHVAPEIVFDESLGKLFVVRTAGHVVDPVALGSIEYAVEHLHVKLLFVLGHESCGAVKAAISGGEAPSNLRALLSRIRPAVNKVLAEGVPESNLLKAAIRENVRYQMQISVFESELLSDFVHQKKLSLAGGVYSLKTGAVELVVTDLAVERIGPKKETAPHPASATGAEPADLPNHPAESQRKQRAEGEHGHAVQPPEKITQTPVTKRGGFEHNLRVAYEKKLDVVLRKTTLMRDEHDRCATDDCRKIAAGEAVKLESPLVLNVMGRPQLKVRYKGKPYYILAETDTIAFVGH